MSSFEIKLETFKFLSTVITVPSIQSQNGLPPQDFHVDVN